MPKEGRNKGAMPPCISPTSEGTMSMRGKVKELIRGFPKLAIVMSAALLALVLTPAHAKTYKCKDRQGNAYYTDRPPPECLGKEMEELSKRGIVVKKYEAALTPEQQAARAAEEKRKKEQEEQALEERRRNQALLNTYSSAQDIEDGRQRALHQVEQSAKAIEQRIAQAQQRAKKLDAEKEFYLKKPLPQKLKDDIRNNDIDLKVQRDALAAKQKERDEINAKYDQDKRRYLELTGANAKK